MFIDVHWFWATHERTNKRSNSLMFIDVELRTNKQTNLFHVFSMSFIALWIQVNERTNERTNGRKNTFIDCSLILGHGRIDVHLFWTQPFGPFPGCGLCSLRDLAEAKPAFKMNIRTSDAWPGSMVLFVVCFGHEKGASWCWRMWCFCFCFLASFAGLRAASSENSKLCRCGLRRN